MSGRVHQEDETKLKATVTQAAKDRTVTNAVASDLKVESTFAGINNFRVYGLFNPVGANPMPQMDIASRKAFMRPTDGTNFQAMFDVAARAGYVKQAEKDRTITSGTVTAEKGDTSYTKVHKDDQQTTAQTATTLWDPTGGKKFVITDIIISTDTAMTITLIDQAAVIYEFYFAANGGCVINLQTPYESTTADNILKYTTSANGKTSISIEGYEV